jgi:hypothetical protein
MPLVLKKKTLYKGRTIFHYTSPEGKVYKTVAGISSHKFTTLAGVKAAIDKYHKKYLGR